MFLWTLVPNLMFSCLLAAYQQQWYNKLLIKYLLKKFLWVHQETPAKVTWEVTRITVLQWIVELQVSAVISVYFGKQNISHLFVVGAGAAKRSTAAVVFTLFPDKVLGDADVEVEFDTTEISLNRCSWKIRETVGILVLLIH